VVIVIIATSQPLLRPFGWCYHRTMIEKAHFIGICGVGMAATALLLKEAGFKITGSDEAFYPPVSTFLEKKNIQFAHQYSPQNIPADVDIIVIGRHAKLTPELNAEVRVAFEKGVPIKSFPEILGDLARDKQKIVVAGSYGKSTCTALAAWCLREADKDPSFFIGALTSGDKMPP